MACLHAVGIPKWHQSGQFAAFKFEPSDSGRYPTKLAEILCFHVNSSRRIWIWRSRNSKHMKNYQNTHLSCFRTSFLTTDFRRRQPAPSHRAWKYNVVYRVDSLKLYLNMFGLNQLHIRAPELILSPFCAKSRSGPIGTTPGPPNRKIASKIAKILYIYIYMRPKEIEMLN